MPTTIRNTQACEKKLPTNGLNINLSYLFIFVLSQIGPASLLFTPASTLYILFRTWIRIVCLYIQGTLTDFFNSYISITNLYMIVKMLHINKSYSVLASTEVRNSIAVNFQAIRVSMTLQIIIDYLTLLCVFICMRVCPLYL